MKLTSCVVSSVNYNPSMKPQLCIFLKHHNLPRVNQWNCQTDRRGLFRFDFFTSHEKHSTKQALYPHVCIRMWKLVTNRCWKLVLYSIQTVYLTLGRTPAPPPSIFLIANKLLTIIQVHGSLQFDVLGTLVHSEDSITMKRTSQKKHSMRRRLPVHRGCESMWSER